MNTPSTETVSTSPRFSFAMVWQGMLLGMAMIATGLLVYDWAGVV